jgi:hypothetical protein
LAASLKVAATWLQTLSAGPTLARCSRHAPLKNPNVSVPFESDR